MKYEPGHVYIEVNHDTGIAIHTRPVLWYGDLVIRSSCYQFQPWYWSKPCNPEDWGGIGESELLDGIGETGDEDHGKSPV